MKSDNEEKGKQEVATKKLDDHDDEHQTESGGATVEPITSAVRGCEHHFTPREPLQTTRPGAYAVAGPNVFEGNGESEEISVESTHTDSAGVYKASAQIFDPEEQNRIHRGRLSQALKEVRSKEIVAEVVTESEDNTHTGARQRYCVLGFIGLILATVTIVLAIVFTRKPPNIPSPSPVPNDLITLISSVSADNGAALTKPTTPQSQALSWLASNSKLSTYDDRQKIQRYALAVFYYSANGASWYENDGWLSDNDECDGWARIDCSENGEVVHIVMEANNIAGTMPIEMALLPLGEFPFHLALWLWFTRTKFEYLHHFHEESIVIPYNRLSGPMPSVLSQLTNLREFYSLLTS